MNKKNLKHFIKKSLAAFLSVLLAVCAVMPASMNKSDAASDDGFNYRVGLVYGKNVKKVISISATDTFDMGFQSLLDDTKSYQQLGTFPKGTIYVTIDGYDINGQVTRGYNLQIPTRYNTYAEAYAQLEKIKDKISGYSLYVAYLNGYYVVRIGDFKNQANAEQNRTYVQSAIGSSYTLDVMAPNSKIICVYNSSGYVIMEYMSTSYNLGIRAKSGYITYNSKTYEGTMAFKRYTTDSYDGVQLVSVLPLERYVMCVMPNEIMTSWPTQTLSAFAITVRSYAVSGRNYNHKNYNFDISATAQVYGMASNIDTKTVKAVTDTKGLVMAYNNKVAEAYYSSSVGGITVGSGDAYVTQYPYLVAVKTPWEKYASLSSGYHGLWTKELTGAQLLSNIKAYGYASLKGSSITKLTVNSYGTGSTYVKSVTVTDNLGNTATISGSDNVRTRLGLYSANFVVGKGSVTYTYDTVTTHTADHKDGSYPAFNLNDFSVRTAAGTLLSRFTGSLKIKTGSGDVTYTSPKANVITGNSTSDGHVVYTTTSTTKTATGASSSFIFAGKGWGHGVGLSQFGIRDLGNMGYTYDEMLNAYYTDIEIVTYQSLGIS